MKTEETLKGQIIEEYLKGGTSFRTLAKKYGFDFRTLHGWVKDYKSALRKQVIFEENEFLESIVSISHDVSQLQFSLQQECLKNRLLNAMIDIAEVDYSISIRKKYGTKQFKK